MDSQSSYLIGYRIERTQNSAARGILCTSKYDRITPTLNYLHWLPVKPRFKFKLLLLKQKKKALNGLAPSYFWYIKTLI